MESRRGFKLYGSAMGSGSATTAHQLMQYKGRILRHFGAGPGTTIDFDSDDAGTFTSFAGTYAEVIQGLRIKSIEVNGNFYFTTSDGIKKISAKNAAGLVGATVSNSGGINALDLQATLNPQPGFFSQESVIAYRQVWGYIDANKNEILGGPSSRTVIYNPLTGLLTSDFNNLLFNLDTLNVATGIHAQNYVATLKVPTNSPASTLRTNLISLASKLDTDIPSFTVQASPTTNLTTTNGSASASVASATNLKIGQLIYTANATVPSGTTITAISGTTITMSANATAGATTSTVFYSVYVNGVASVLLSTSTATTANSTSLTVTSATGLVVGQYVTGTGIPNNTTITAISGTTVTISNAATATSSASSLAFTYILPSATSFIVTLVLSSTPTNILSVSDSIKITNVVTSPSSPNLFNGSYTVSSVSPTLITYSTNTTTNNLTTANYPGAYLSGGTAQRIKYTSITQPVILSGSPTTDQLQSLQTYYSTIVSDLQLEPSGIVTGTPFNSDNATTSATVNLKFFIPQGITSAYFYQIYRTAQSLGGTGVALGSLDPGDEEELVFEGNPTAQDLINGYITLQDITPDSFRGANLYTNENTGDGILQSNNPPPLATDIASYKNYTFYSNTITKHSLSLSMLSDLALVSGTSTITITDGTTTNTYTFVLGVAQIQTVTTVADVSSSLNSRYFTLWSGTNATEYYIWYSIGGAGVDPAVANATGIKVSASVNATAATIASLTQTALNKVGDFTVSVLSNVITITNTTAGISTAAANGTASPGFTYSVSTTGVGEDIPNKKILISSLPTPSQQVDEAARSLVRVINGNSSELIYAFYLSGPTDIPGLLLFEAKNLGQNPFYIVADSVATGSEFSPALTSPESITSISVANPTVVTSAAHGLSNNASIIIYGSNSTPNINGIQTISGVTTNTFTVPVNVTISGNTGKIINTSTAQVSTDEALPNRIYYSKVQQPEAVPIVNTLDIGPQDKQILRILALRDSLFVLKEEAIYRVSGQSAPFTVSLFDSSTLLKAPDSAAILNNLIYMFSTQGIASVSETGVSIISRPIEDDLIKLIGNNYANFTTATFGVGYESDRTYNVWTVSKTTDSFATKYYRYNTFTNAWTDGDLTGRSAIINSNDDKMYLAPTDTNFIEQERKNFDRTDYADREIDITINSNSVIGSQILLTSLANISVGDAFTQTQYLTIKEFNRLLSKLDNDTKLTSTYKTNNTAVAGDVLSDDLDALIAAIANDPIRTNVSGHTSSATYLALLPTATDFVSIQTNYNNLINLLNSDNGTSYKNYILSSGTTIYEFTIESLNTLNDSITTTYAYPIIAGPVVIYNHIDCQAQWVPQYLQDVSMSKHVSEATVIFEDSSFDTASISFSSDLSANFEPQEIFGLGNGEYGNNVYGTGVYGGNGAAIPFRTLIPREKQRCRYLNLLFEHSVAREIYSLYGISLTYNPVSQRAYR